MQLGKLGPETPMAFPVSARVLRRPAACGPVPTSLRRCSNSWRENRKMILSWEGMTRPIG